jgi:hypothetical protein
MMFIVVNFEAKSGWTGRWPELVVESRRISS